MMWREPGQGEDKMRWAIQKNLINKDDHVRLMEACSACGVEAIPFDAVPFSEEIPDIPGSRTVIWYGATFLMTLVSRARRWWPGVWFDEENFNCRTYHEEYGEEFFNYGCEFMTLGDVLKMTHSADREFFVRPVRDGKEFSGGTLKFGELVKWAETLDPANPLVNRQTEILVAEPFAIAHEWRLFIIRGKVSSGSHYREYMRLKPSKDVPQHVIEYAERMAAKWSPAPVFVMDVAESGDELRVMEINCFNSSGFYETDVRKVVADVTNLVRCTLSAGTFSMEPAEYVGKFPIRQDVTVILPDPKAKRLSRRWMSV